MSSSIVPNMAAVQPLAAASDEQFIRIEQVVKKFGETTAVSEVTLNIQKHELFALLGSSGCGKSTLLRMLAGLEMPTSGKIYIDGEDLAGIPPYQRPTNMMFQSYALFPHMTVEGNISFGLEMEGVSKDERAVRVNAALDLVQMRKYARRKPHQLSGGQQQRVALARSLVKRPKLLLLDEPMSALDKKIRQQTQMELVRILKTVGVTCVMVTHDQEEAMTMATRLAVMSEGKIVQVGTPKEVYEHPATRFAANFIGVANQFDGHTVEDEPDHVYISSNDLEHSLYVNHGITGPLGMNVSISVRPERIRLSRTAPEQQVNCGKGIVDSLAYMGSYTVFHLRLASGKIVVANESSMGLLSNGSFEIGEEVWFSWDAPAGKVLTI